jgi:hypothetical protein
MRMREKEKGGKRTSNSIPTLDEVEVGEGQGTDTLRNLPLGLYLLDGSLPRGSNLFVGQ